MSQTPTPRPLGGVIHTYQKYDPVAFPSPTQDPPDMASAAMEHLLMYGNTRRLTEEELARAVRIDPRQFASFGPSLDALDAILRERKEKILRTYETDAVQQEAQQQVQDAARQAKPPTKKLADRFHKAMKDEHLAELENLWYAAEKEGGPFAGQLLRLAERMGEQYQVDELAGKYEFTGREGMDVPKALAVKEELEKIDKLLEQIQEAMKTGQIGVIDIDELAEFAEPGDLEQLSALQQQIQDYMRELAEQQGLEQNGKSFQLTPKATRLFQGKLLETIFSALEAGRTGRHTGPIIGEGAAEIAATRPYEFGDSVAHLDIPQTFTNAMIRQAAQGPGAPLRLHGDDIVVHKTRNNPKAATCVMLDMSGSMRYGGTYVDVKRMGLALDGLIRTQYPGDYLQFIEMYSFAKPRHSSELATLMPKPVTIYDPWVALKVDMSDPDVSETLVPPHFTNIQHALRLGRQYLTSRDTPNKQMILITDGLPTAHFEKEVLYLLYPPNPRTEEATLKEGMLCAKEGIVLNIFLIDSWSQSSEDIKFARRLAESTKGRVIFTGGKDLERFVVWDYVSRKKSIVA